MFSLKKIIVFYLILIFEISIISAKSKVPEWISKTPEIKSGIFFVGQSGYKRFNEEDRALENARTEALKLLGNYISTNISQFLKIHKEISVTNKNIRRTNEFLENGIKMSSDAEIFNCEFKEAYIDKRNKRCFVLAYISNDNLDRAIAKSLDPIGYELGLLFYELHEAYNDINSLSITNFNYKGRDYSAEISAYLRSKISEVFANLDYLREYRNDEFKEHIDVQGYIETRGVIVEENEELQKMYDDVQGFINGNYWEHENKIEFNVKIFDIRKKDYIFSKTFNVSKKRLDHLKLHPDNVDAVEHEYEEIAKMFESQTFNIKVWPDKGNYSTYAENDLLIPHFTSNKNCYVRIYLVSADGNSILLFPNKYDKNNYIKKNRVYKVGDPSFSPFKLRLSKPYGTEMIIAIATIMDFDNEIDVSATQVYSSSDLRGLIMESVDKTNKQNIAQSSCYYTIIPEID